MTVNGTPNFPTSVGNGATVAFAFNNLVLETNDVLVTLLDDNGAIVSAVENGAGTYDYVVSGTYDTDKQSYPSVTITFNTAPPTDYSINLTYDVDLAQGTDYSTFDDFPAETHERALDKLTLIAQSLNWISDRSLRLAAGDTSDGGATLGTLPSQTARADKVLGFDADGEPIASTPAATAAATSATAAATSATAAATSATTAAAAVVTALAAKITISTSAPSGGSSGDIWYRVTV